MHKPEIWKLVLLSLNPGRSEANPTEWRHLVHRSIVPEVKQEIIRFYGSNDELESQYPGLDYTSRNHRLRLSSWPFHCKLFQAFDALRLTDDEIYTLCKWHGTKRARDEYERRHAIQIADTTLDEIQPYSRPAITVTYHEPAVSDQLMGRSGQRALFASEAGQRSVEANESLGFDSRKDPVDASDDESEDEVQRSIGVELNQRLRANAEANVRARARGEPVSTDLDWEQWIKEAAEREAPQTSSTGLGNVLATVLARPMDSLSDLAPPFPSALILQDENAGPR